MPNMTYIYVRDDAGTQRTLIPITDTPNPKYRSNDANVPLNGQMQMNVYWEELKSGDYKGTVKLEVPVLETLGASGTSGGYVAPPKVAYVTTLTFTMYVSKRATIADRANACRMMTSILAGASSTVDTGIAVNTATADLYKNASTTAVVPYFMANALLPF